MTIHVMRPGLLTTVQDLGRPGFQASGIGPGGAMDRVALRLANALVANPPDAAALEITLAGPALRFDRDALIAIAGASLSPTVDGTSVHIGRAIRVRAGATLAFGAPTAGSLAYLAVSGGIDVPIVLGSRATHLRAKFGGYAGRAIRTGDVLQLGNPSTAAMHVADELGARESWAAEGSGFGREFDTRPQLDAPVRMLPGERFTRLDPGEREAFLSTTFRVSNRSDRMGYRLEGPVIFRAPSDSLTSEAVAWGAVQVPPDGQPIVLLADRQTTGGYPVIGHVASIDLPFIAQRRPGDPVRFALISLEQAQRELVDREQSIAAAIRALTTARSVRAGR